MTNDADLLRREHAISIFRAAVAAVNPRYLVSKALGRDRGSIELTVAVSPGDTCRWALPAVVVGAGKGAARMAAACQEILGPQLLCGCVVVNDGSAQCFDSITVVEAGHPIPDERSCAAAQRILQLVESTPAPTVLVLISGGASSLLVAPRMPVTLADKIATTELLLRCGADISEVNSVRKHLSDVKGGGLLRRARRPTVTLIISDVVGDDPGTIGSGPSVADRTTFGDAWAVIERYRLVGRVPTSVEQFLRRGVANLEPETLKPNAPETRFAAYAVIGSNRLALDGAALAAERLGWSVKVVNAPLAGDTKVAAQRFAQTIQDAASTSGLCILAGGETTVEVKGPGRGGRNQEFALHMSSAVRDLDVTILSAGTDGIDGPTDAAGAFVDGRTLLRGAQMRLDADAALRSNDSYAFFDQLGDLWRCGPTGTNVMDIKIALIGTPSLCGRL